MKSTMATQNVSKRLLSLAKERLDSAEANEPTPVRVEEWPTPYTQLIQFSRETRFNG